MQNNGSTSLWSTDEVQDIQQRWRDVQWRFVDDPRAAADEAHALVTEALDRFSTTVASRKTELDGWRAADGADGDSASGGDGDSANGGDTERMRTVVRQYRDLLDRLLEV